MPHQSQLEAPAVRNSGYLGRARRTIAAGLMLVGLVGAAVYAQASPELTRGLAWLQAQVSADGTVSGESAAMATPAQVRAEVALTLSALTGAPSVPNALRAQQVLVPDEPTEHLARKAIALSSFAGDAVALTRELSARQNADGGFGGAPGYASSVLDTVWAYAALARAPVFSGAGNARAYLLAKLDADGGLSGSSLGQRIQNTALGILALQFAGSDLSALNASRQMVLWLQARQQTDGSWNSSTYQTAVALYALSTQGADPAQRASARAYLLGKQSPDGHWDADPFLTAVVLRAVAIDPAATPVASSIAGTAIDLVTGTPVAGVQVSLNGAVGSAVTTSASGRFAFSGLTSGSYTVRLVKAVYAPSTRQAALGYGQSLELGTIAMGQVSTTGVVKGKVMGATSGLPVSGATVALSGAASASGVTDAQGNYEFAAVPVGAVTLAISKTGFVTATATGAVVAGQTLNFSPTLYDTGAGGVPTTGRLIGKLVIAGTGADFAGVAIELNGVNAGVSGPDGRFDLTLPPLAYTLRLAPSGYDAVTANFLLTAGSVVDAGTITLSPQRTTTAISGRVTDLVTGLAVSGAQVTPVGGTSVTSDLNGSYALSNLTGTVFDLRIAAAGYATQTLQLQVERPAVVVQDFALSPQPSGAIDLINLIAQPTSVGPQTPVSVLATVINNGAAAQEIVLRLQVQDADGKVVAAGSAFTADGVNVLGAFSLAAGEQRAVRLQWNSGQFPPGSYRLVGSAVEAGSLSTDNPNGRVLVARSTSVNVSATVQITGGVTASPPVLRANTGVTVKLSALVQNSGNADIPAQTYQIRVINDANNTLVTSSQVAATAVLPNQFQTLNFADWVPTTGGNFRLEVIAVNAPEMGQLAGKLYVGDAATASYTVNKAVVPVGNQTAKATLLITGQDSATGTISDPLAGPIRAAIQKGVTYNDLQGANWVQSGRCLGCHAVSQAVVGGEVNRRLTSFNSAQRNTLINALTNHVQSNGAVYISHPEHSKTQTMFGLWALNSVHSKDELAASLSRVADYVVARQDGDGGWTADHESGWGAFRPANTGFHVKNLTEVIDTLKRVPSPTAYSQQSWSNGHAAYGPYYLNKTPTDQVLVSNFNAGTVSSINADGTRQLLISGLLRPQGLVQAADGSIYVATGNGLIKRSTDGTNSVFAAKPVGADPTGLVIGPDGNFYMAAHGTQAIYRITPSGLLTTFLSVGPLYGPAGMAFDSSGNLMVINNLGLNILRIRPDKSYDVVVSWTNGAPRSIVPSGDGWLVGTNNGLFRYNRDWVGERLSFAAADGLVVLSDNTIVVGDGFTSVSKLVPAPVNSAAKIASYSNAIGRATPWLLNSANINAASNLDLAAQLIGLGNANRFYQGQPLAATTLTKMEQVATVLRARQRADGGWGKLNTSTSDALVTAQVGFALDYLQPTASDPVVQNAIKYLLAKQLPDGSWASDNNGFTTRLAATTWVEIWLPIALDRIGGIDAAVTLKFAPNVAVSNPNVAPTTTISNPDGSVTRNWQFTGVTSASRSIEFDVGLTDMQLGEVRPLSTEAFLTFRNSFTNESINASIPIPTISASAFLGLGLSTDKVVYGPNTPVVISGQVANLGLAAAGGSVEFAIYAVDGVPAAALGRVPFSALGVGSTGAVPALWNTGTYYAGQYFVEAKLYDSANRYVATARSVFAIRTSDVAGANTVTGQIRTDKLTYAPTDSVRLTDRISNLALNQNMAGLTIETSVVNPDGSVRWTATAPLLELVAGTLRDVSYVVPLNTAPAGGYTARLVVKDASGTVVATDTKSFAVQSSAITGAGLSGTIQATPKQVPLGDVVTLNFDVSNLGNDALTNLPLTVNLVDPVVQQLLATFPFSTNMNVGATYAANANWTSTGVVGSTYVAVLSAEIAGSSIVLAQDSLTVIEPPVRFDVTPAVRKDARLLVLVSCQPGDGNGNGNGNSANSTDDATCTNARAQWLSAFLTAQGIAHHISTTVQDFSHELYCGRYNTFWLSGGSNKLGANLVKEIREAVYAGSGLIIDGTHDERNGLLDEIPGVNYRGKLPQSGYTVQLNAPVFAPATLASSGTALKYDLAGGTARASFTSAAGVPSVITNTYGKGDAALFAFDLVGSLQAGGWTGAFLSGLTFVAPALPSAYPGGAWVPLSLTLKNQAQANVVVVTAQLPAGVRLDGVPPGATVDVAGNPSWQFSLAANETRELSLPVRAPYVSGLVSLPVQISTIRSGVTRLYSNTSLEFSVAAADTQGVNLVNAIRALEPTSQPQRNARDRAATDVQNGLTLLVQGSYANAALKFLSAADELASITTTSVAVVRGSLASLIAEAEARQCVNP